MRCIAVVEPGRLELVERPLPEPRGAEVRLDVGFCGICGSDLHLREVAEPGTVLGHELAGTVSAIGPEVHGWRLGDPASVRIYRNCGQCRYCRAGSESQCIAGGHHDDVIGVQRPGGYAEAVLADAAALHTLPAGLSLKHAALAEPVSIGVRAAAAVEVAASDPVLVIGAGPIGLFAAFALRARGYERVHLVERNPVRARAAAELGFPTLDGDRLEDEILEREIGEPAAVVECAASPAAARTAVALLRRQGRLIMVGLPSRDVAFPADTLVLNEIQVRGVAGTSHANFRRALELLSDGSIPADALITAVVGLERAEAMFAELRDPATQHVKVLLAP